MWILYLILGGIIIAVLYYLKVFQRLLLFGGMVGLCALIGWIFDAPRIGAIVGAILFLLDCIRLISEGDSTTISVFANGNQNEETTTNVLEGWVGIFIFVVASVLFVADSCSSSSGSKSDTNKTESLYSRTTTYICTARKSLKVRTAPDANAEQLGSLAAGEEVEVYEIVGDFARIQFNGSEGYASIKYLQQK